MIGLVVPFARQDTCNIEEAFVARVFRPPDTLICSERECLVERPTQVTPALQDPYFPVNSIEPRERLFLLALGETRDAQRPQTAVSGVGHVPCRKASV